MKLSSGICTASKQRKARTKTTIIKFLFSRNIRSLRNTTRSNERYVPITGYRRQLYKDKYIKLCSLTRSPQPHLPEHGQAGGRKRYIITVVMMTMIPITGKTDCRVLNF